MEVAAGVIEKEGKNVVVGSMDVVGLYPNLNIRKSAEAVGKAARESKIEYVNTNWEHAQKYVAMCMSQEEIDKEGLGAVIPRRKSKKGTRPGLSDEEL